MSITIVPDNRCDDCGFWDANDCLCEPVSDAKPIFFEPSADCINCEEPFNRKDPTDNTERFCRDCRINPDRTTSLKFSAAELASIRRVNKEVMQKWHDFNTEKAHQNRLPRKLKRRKS